MTPSAGHGAHIRRAVSRLTAGAPDAGRIFGWPGATYGWLYATATGLRREMAAIDEAAGALPGPVCLCSADRAVATAALLASLAGGPPLVMPHACSETVLAEMQHLTRFRYAIVDGSYPLPPDTRRIDATRLEKGNKDLKRFAPLNPDSPWVHLFTGGSTGAPQLWTKTVRNLLGEAAFLKKAFAVSGDDRVLTTSPPYHIYGLLYSVLVPLLADAAVVLDTPAFPGELSAAIRQAGPTILVTVPAYYRTLRHHLSTKSRLRMAFSSASPLADGDAEAFTRATGAPVYDVYGSTETGGIASRCIAAGEAGYTPFAPVDVQIHHHRLWVRSPFVAPQLPLNEQGYFEASDRVQDGQDGTFTVIGRADGVIKVGGKRVDMAEVRSRLLALKDVRDALVFARPTATGRGNEILALVETDRPKTDISRALEPLLTPYARPRVIRVVTKMPVTHTGKYDREKVASLFNL